jgi:hypothetical protein
MNDPLDTRTPQAAAHEAFIQASNHLAHIREEGSNREVAAAERAMQRARREWHRLVEEDRAAFDARHRNDTRS